MKQFGFVLAVLAVGWGPPAWAVTTGNDLFALCGEQSGTKFRGLCMAYLKGVLDAGGVSASPSQGEVISYSVGGLRFCIPFGVNTDQVVDVTFNWLKANPKIRHLPGAMLIAKAASEAWPYKK